MMDCELSIVRKNIDERVINKFIGDVISQNDMMASSSDLHEAFEQYSESILSQMNETKFWQLNFMEVLDNYNIMYLFYGSRLLLYDKDSFTLEGDKRKQLVVRSQTGGFSDSQYMWNTIKNININRYEIKSCGRLKYLPNL